jgi:hypothetical protein
MASGSSASRPEPPPAVSRWAGPSRRARAIAVALAIACAALTFVVVNRVWRRAAPPPPVAPTSVEVRLVPLAPAASPPRH